MTRKQAVLLIHGIGEQKPMDTLNGFVDAVWRTDTGIQDASANVSAGALVWSKPDTVSDNFELRRLVTPHNAAGISTDFFEFYWQHLLQGTTYGQVAGWVASLLFRKPSTVPAHLRGPYWLLLILCATVVALALYALGADATERAPLESAWVAALISLALIPAVGFVIRSIIGDAARYLHVAPPNVQCRHAIRQAGIQVLNSLHDRGYERIIVVGHSLGSVIGYDILTSAWLSYHNVPPSSAAPSMAGLEALERLAREPDGASIDDIQALQRAYFNELVANGSKWRVTDFLTLGSPLAHAEVLLARDRAELAAKREGREFPTCLPVLETVTRGASARTGFSFELVPRRPDLYRVPHHAAVFAPTRWTNFYFPNRWIVRGDLIGGPLRPVLGKGIRDEAVTTSQRSGFLSHTLYWRMPPGKDAPEHIRTLRNALDLRDRRSATPAKMTA